MREGRSMTAFERDVVSSGRAALATLAAGEGAPVVFLHAGVADHRMWQQQLATAAAEGFRAIAYDRRGFGASLHADETWSHVSDLLRVLDHCAGGQRAILVGCSQGGRIALDAALAHPDRVRALVLVAPAVSGAPVVDTFPPAIEAMLVRLEEAEISADVDRINAMEAHVWLDGPGCAEGRVDGTARSLFLEMNGIALRAEARGEEIAPSPAYGRLEAIHVPTLVVWGDLDFPHLCARCEHLAATLPGARAVPLPGMAHLPSLEAPAAFDAVLVPFLREVRASAV